MTRRALGLGVVASVVVIALVAAGLALTKGREPARHAVSTRAVPTAVRHEKLQEAGERRGYSVSRVGNRVVVSRPDGTEEGDEQGGDESDGDRRSGEPEGGGELLSGPSAVQVDQRAFPRAYVETRRAVAGRRAFRELPPRAAGSDFRAKAVASGSVGARALSSDWGAIGPVDPQVPGFVTYTGRDTTNSGRTTAMAIDPNCSQSRCRLWVAAAGGGIWRTTNALAQTPTWQAVDRGLTTNSFGSIIVDPSDSSGDTLYAGSGEPNGSGDSEAGLGLFRSTDGGDSWSLVPGSYRVAHDRSIASIAIDPRDPDTIWIATALARHGLASVQGGRRTPPNAPTLGVYRSTDGGDYFTLELNRPGASEDPATGNDYFTGAATKLVFDPNDPKQLYASIQGYGLFRIHNPNDGPCGCDDGQWHQMYQALFGSGTFLTEGGEPVAPDPFGARVDFDLADLGSHTRIYVGDTADGYGIAMLITGEGIDAVSNGDLLDAEKAVDTPAGMQPPWDLRSNPDITASLDGFSSFNFCQNGQCGYDIFVTADPTNPDTVWLGGAMAYDELDAFGSSFPRSNGRAVVRSTDVGVSFKDMTNDATAPPTGQHPDQHALVFNPNDHNQVFIGSDGGVLRTDGSFVDASDTCDTRSFTDPTAASDRAFCRQVLSTVPGRIDAINTGLNTLQFQSLSLNAARPYTDVIGGTQDNGTWAWDGASNWFESVGGDGGQSGISDAGASRMHTYFGASMDVNFHGNDPQWWANVSGPMDEAESTGEESFSFYVPVISDPKANGTYFMAGEYVWRTRDSGGDKAFLDANCLEGTIPSPAPDCGDFERVGRRLSADGPAGNDFIVALARAPSDTGTMWVGLREGELFISRTIDQAAGSVKYRRLTDKVLPQRFVSGISVDPTDPNHAWISFSGYGAYTPGEPGHVFEARYDPSTGKAIFTDRSYNLGDQPITGVQFDQPSGDAYASTDFGVARLPRGGNTWTDAAGGMPKVATYGLTMSSSGRVIYAATHGRGAYRLPLNPAARITGPSSGGVGQSLTYSSAGSTGYKGTHLRWRLPSGRTSAASTVTWTPTATGRQNVRLTVTDELGHSTTTTRTVDVAKHAGLTPKLGKAKSKPGGFTVQVKNFSGSKAFTWRASTTRGKASIGTGGKVKVTRLKPDQQARITVKTSRPGYAPGSASATGKSTRACAISVTARSASSGVPGNGKVTLVRKVKAGAGCRLRPAKMTVSPAGKSGSVTVSGNLSAGEVKARTSGAGQLSIRVREKVKPKNNGRNGTWTRTWRTK